MLLAIAVNFVILLGSVIDKKILSFVILFSLSLSFSFLFNAKDEYIEELKVVWHH